MQKSWLWSKLDKQKLSQLWLVHNHSVIKGLIYLSAAVCLQRMRSKSNKLWIGCLLFMSDQVPIQSASLSSGIIAQMTFVRFVTSVNHNVPFQIFDIWHHSSADRTQKSTLNFNWFKISKRLFLLLQNNRLLLQREEQKSKGMFSLHMLL